MRTNHPISLPPDLLHILHRLPEAYVVGGFVRDHFLNINNNDIDIEVFHISYKDLADGLNRFGSVNIVGQKFGVIKLKLNGVEYDFSIPRKDNKVGVGHAGFDCEFNPDMTIEQAAKRRDFTCNALSYDPVAQQIVDPFDGLKDIKANILRYVDKDTFTDDPLRVLRAMQFCGRFEMIVSFELGLLCKEMKPLYSEISKERIFTEWQKFAVKSKKPSLGFVFLTQCGWLELYPEIFDMFMCEQDKVFHPEGDTLIHTCHCLDHLVTLPEYKKANRDKRMELFFAVLCHDMGKPATTKREFVSKHGRVCITSKGHEQEGVPIAENFLQSINAPNAVIDRVKPLVGNHLAHMQATTSKSVRRLANRLHPATIEDLVTIIAADHGGRPPLPKELPEQAIVLLEKSKQLKIDHDTVKPIIMGRHLIELGLKPGPAFSIILKDIFSHQMDGDFNNEADGLVCLTEYLDSMRNL